MWLGFCVKHLSGLVWTKIKIGKWLVVLCQLVASKNLDSFLVASALCIIGTFFDMSTANCGFGHFVEF